LCLYRRCPSLARVLVARTKEQRRIEVLLEDAREGMSGALMLVGEPGIGKTALLEHAAAGADGFQILRPRGVPQRCSSSAGRSAGKRRQ
jgi:predicted NACHT family NTPase